MRLTAFVGIRVGWAYVEELRWELMGIETHQLSNTVPVSSAALCERGAGSCMHAASMTWGVLTCEKLQGEQKSPPQSRSVSWLLNAPSKQVDSAVSQ